ncbi:MAG: ATP-binding protein [Cyanobacteria bacterium P01_F01_bin.150]
MDALRTQDMSLYEAALGSDCPPSPLKISPTTFKSMVESLFDVLIEHDQSATLWIKLPREKVWHASVQSYRQNVKNSEPLYVLKTRKDEPAKEITTTNAQTVSSAAVQTYSSGEESPQTSYALETNPSVGGLNNSLRDTLSPWDVWLSPDSRLRREFFILAVSSKFQGLVLAHRPRSARKQSASLDSSTMGTKPPSSPNSGTEDSSERKTPLLGFCSFNPSTIQAVLAAISQSVSIGCAQYPEEESVLAPHIEKWQQTSDALPDSTLDPNLMGSFWTRHLRHQEELWRNNTTARKQADKASDLELKNEELLNSIRLKDEFFKTVGQELRTPLTTMKTALSLLGSPSLKVNQRQRYMDLLTKECDRQSALITSVLELMQLENVDDQATLQPIRLMDVIPGVVSTYQPLAQEKGIMLAYTVPENLPTVSGLNTWLRQIVINLLHNAIKFTPEGGKVWVRAKQQGDYVQVEVRDTGIGIAMADIPKIFNRFYRVRPGSGEDSGGAGLGLSIVQQLLLRCGGSVTVNSRQGDGATFNVLMPVYQQDDD